MIRYFVGIFLMLLGSLFGFARGGGKVSALFHISEIVLIGAILLGAVTAAFGFGRFAGMIWDGIARSDSIDATRRAGNIRICECASAFSIYGGLIATLAGLIITLGSWSTLPDANAERLAACATGILSGLVLLAVVFQPLKYRFLSYESH